ncbi:MAG TPA: B12-binding domain-containing radical SAM protein, partial [bacterium]|nr:B12-binding domain-containing radical SAM protein [bacterium]
MVVSPPMSWELKEALRKKLAGEQGAIVREPGGRTPLALIYPNTYAVGMGNLAIHSLYRMANSRPDLACERFFLPDRGEAVEYGRTGAELMSVEAQRPLSEFAIAAFSISFENDLMNLLPLLSLARIPHRAAERDPDSPVLVAGGAAATLNPRPLSAIFDAVVQGEAECFAEELFPLLAGRLRKEEVLREMARIPGIWVPSLSPAPDAAARRFLQNLDAWPTETVIHSETAEFGKMHLVELQR